MKIDIFDSIFDNKTQLRRFYKYQSSNFKDAICLLKSILRVLKSFVVIYVVFGSTFYVYELLDLVLCMFQQKTAKEYFESTVSLDLGTAKTSLHASPGQDLSNDTTLNSVVATMSDSMLGQTDGQTDDNVVNSSSFLPKRSKNS
jgi:hypothetical protein